MKNGNKYRCAWSGSRAARSHIPKKSIDCKASSTIGTTGPSIFLTYQTILCACPRGKQRFVTDLENKPIQEHKITPHESRDNSRASDFTKPSFKDAAYSTKNSPAARCEMIPDSICTRAEKA